MQWGLFEGVEDEQVRELLTHARRRRFSRGESVFHEGDPGDSLHLLERGHLAVRITTPNGDVATLRILRPGDHFGDLAVMSTGRRSATVTAIERAETLELSGDIVLEFQERHRSFEHAATRALAATVRSLSTALLEAMYLPAPRRVARRLVDLREIYGTSEIPLTQDDLAGLSGTTRQTVNQVLIDLRGRGAVELAHGRVTVVDEEALARAGR